MDANNLPLRILNALDPRPGDGWTPMKAARSLVLVIVAAALWIASLYFGVPIPQWLDTLVTIAAASVVGHDTGLVAPPPKDTNIVPPAPAPTPPGPPPV